MRIPPTAIDPPSFPFLSSPLLSFSFLSFIRVLREENDPRWESGKIKPDDGMRDLGELFEEAPSVESYPEYHVKVKNIMDLNTIKQKVCDCVCVGVCLRVCFRFFIFFLCSLTVPCINSSLLFSLSACF